MNDKAIQFCYLFAEGEFNSMLTVRERECLFFILQRKTIKETGKILSVSPRTIEEYLARICIKLQCQTKSEVMEKAILNNFFSPLPIKYLIELWQNH